MAIQNPESTPVSKLLPGAKATKADVLDIQHKAKQKVHINKMHSDFKDCWPSAHHPCLPCPKAACPLLPSSAAVQCFGFAPQVALLSSPVLYDAPHPILCSPSLALSRCATGFKGGPMADC